MIRFLSFGLVTLFASNVFAIDTARCPGSIELTVDIKKVYQSSIYKKVPGWVEAQKTLNSITGIQAELDLVATTKNCIYKDDGHTRAVLSTASFRDPEEHDPSLNDQLILNLDVDGVTYVSFVPVRSYNRRGIELYSNPFSVKIKTPLYFENATPKRFIDIDLGMISVSAK